MATYSNEQLDLIIRHYSQLRDQPDPLDLQALWALFVEMAILARAGGPQQRREFEVTVSAFKKLAVAFRERYEFHVH
jgi:hypothetical protein